MTQSPLSLEQIVSLDSHPIEDVGFIERCRCQLDKTGSLLLNGFISDLAIECLEIEAKAHANAAYYCTEAHTAYLSAPDPALGMTHARNRQVQSSKGCITDDQIPTISCLRVLYDSKRFRTFLSQVLSEKELYHYADPLSSVNGHYYQDGQELGWHFDNSSFAVTLMIQQPDGGGHFEYIPKLRDCDAGEMNFAGVDQALDGKIKPIRLDIRAGTLALFRGRNSLHRVTPVRGDRNRIQVVLAYNTEPGIALSEQARLTFYGRVT